MVTDKRELEEAVSTHATRAAEKMRQNNLATSRLVGKRQGYPIWHTAGAAAIDALS
jgi:hypothetical protein